VGTNLGAASKLRDECLSFLDHTHDPNARSWVASANDGVTDFPIQNLPLGIVKAPNGVPIPVVVIGDQVLDLRRLAAVRPLRAPTADALSGDTLEALLALGRTALRQPRHEVFSVLLEHSST
jgi:fumarylacetoacetase